MLADAKKFEMIEKTLRENGTIANFEKEHGKIQGRMMITLTEIPKEPEIHIDSSSCYAFNGSFDFYNTSVGVVINTKTKKIASGVWITQQTDGAVNPADEWIGFFVQTLLESISEDGSFGYPIFTFISDDGDFSVVPTK